MRVRLALLLSSLALAALVGWVILESADEEWRRHQLDYYDRVLARSSGARVKEAIRRSGLEIKQDVLTGFGEERRADRCRSCHMAIDDPSFAGAPQPHRAHPATAKHAFGDFGCTICHEGNGRGLTARDAHGKGPFWPEPLLRGPYIESACARCHPEPYLEETPNLRLGRALFERTACVGCHTIQGVSRGTLGADLTSVGTRLSIEAMRAKILDPGAAVPMSIMPRFRLVERELTALVVFLKSRRGRALVEDPVTLRIKTQQWKAQSPAPVQVGVEEGRKAVESRGCTACHALGAADGGLAPDLGLTRMQRSAAFIAEHLRDPRGHVTGSNMPAFWMSTSEREAIAAYIGSLPETKPPATPPEQYRTLCQRCHGERGAGDGVTARNLVPRPRDFTNAKFFDWLPDERAHQAILGGVPGTAMPPFERLLDRAQAVALFDWIRTSFTKSQRQPAKARKLPARSLACSSAESAARGAREFAERCYGCHGRRGDGKGPNAADMLPRPRDLSSHAFLAQAGDLRLFESITYGVVGTGMPPWDYLSEERRWDLVSFLRALSRTPCTDQGGP
jgi:mono/diheme cytochrome c family protein